MGMLGAMAGAGSGLQDYSTMLNEKQKMDWEARAEDVKYQRAQNMESLRNTNAETRQIAAEDRATTRLGEDRVYAEGMLGKAQDREDTIRGEDREYAMDVKAQDRTYDIKALTAELSARGKASLDSAIGIAKASVDLDVKQRRAEVDAYRASDAFKSADPKTRENIIFAMEHPGAAALIASQEKGKKAVTPEVYSKNYNLGIERWETVMSKESKKPLQDRMAAEGITAPEEQADAFATYFADQSTTIGRESRTRLEPLTSQEKEEILADAKKGLISEEDLKVIEKDEPELAKRIRLMSPKELSAAARTAMPTGGVLSNVASKQELTPGRQGIGILRNAFSGTDDEGVSDLQRKAAMEFK